ncbi:MAG: GNAT family N-acetyltransferase [Ignavibacteriae bacterium]|nr:GNAT family N-acetyltransferase [Ignavibacteriota bacterium]MCB9217111.1 GNAT family N-acetyltransferase [Ignavibacteria bacterium]
MNSNYAVREATAHDAEGIARVHIDSWRTTYRGIVPDNVLENMDFAQRSELWRERLSSDRSNRSGGLILVATNLANEIVGFASGGKEREGNIPSEAEIYALYLLKEYSRKGIGRYLTRELALQLQQKNYSSMLVWVLARNLSRQFYQHLGGVESRRKLIDIGGEEFEEIAYRWENISTLLR